MTANSSQLEQRKFDYFCLSKQYITSSSSISSITSISIKQTKNISMDAIPIIILFLLESTWFTIYYYLNRFLYMFKIFQLTEQNMYVPVTYRNPMFCIYVLHKRRGQFFGAHSRIFFFFLNSVGDTIFFNSVYRMSHIFGPNVDIVSEPCMTGLILLP